MAEHELEDLGSGPRRAGPGRLGAVAQRLTASGHGSASIVVFQRKETGLVHAVNAVNHDGKVIWVDPQMGRVSATPMYEGTLFMTITLDAHFTPVDPPAAHPTALTS
ncbi:toxin glutamine deamidase domain-containing protein [Streptomyces prasinus]|uniref:toxin glutamine deamidase domain-containing protein n=1 Tax=Streptomyces prasinus TaxID=67345 RepID=UPI0033BF64E2